MSQYSDIELDDLVFSLTPEEIVQDTPLNVDMVPQDAKSTEEMLTNVKRFRFSPIDIYEATSQATSEYFTPEEQETIATLTEAGENIPPEYTTRTVGVMQRAILLLSREENGVRYVMPSSIFEKVSEAATRLVDSKKKPSAVAGDITSKDSSTETSSSSIDSATSSEDTSVESLPTDQTAS